MEQLEQSKIFTLMESGPVVLVTTHDGKKDNIMTISWTMVIILYQRGDATAIDVRLNGDTVWLSLNQIADLLGRDKSTISRHNLKQRLK